jgi:MoaA/NifB/PqqE/SkfB family radical SAM enzyme
MRPEVFSRVAPYFRYASIVEFIGRGEPTLNPSLPAFMQAASSAGCWVRMFTNGTRLGPELAAFLVKAGVDEIVLSLLGGDRESYRFITERDELDAIVDNFRTLRDVKRHLGSSSPQLSICSTLLAGSLDSAPGVVRIAAELQIPNIHFGASYVIKPEMEEESLTRLPRERVEAVFQECRRLSRELGVSVVLPPLEEDLETAPPMAENAFGCLKPWQSVLVRADGQVEVCSYNRKIVGDLRRDEFPAIWNGPEFLAFRRDEVRFNGANLCDLCYHRAFRGRRASRASQFPYATAFDGYR